MIFFFFDVWGGGGYPKFFELSHGRFGGRLCADLQPIGRAGAAELRKIKNLSHVTRHTSALCLYAKGGVHSLEPALLCALRLEHKGGTRLGAGLALSLETKGRVHGLGASSALWLEAKGVVH